MADDSSAQPDIWHQYPEQVFEPGTVVYYRRGAVDFGCNVVLDMEAESKLLGERLLGPYPFQSITVPVRSVSGGPCSWIDPEWVYKTEPAGTLAAEAAEADAAAAEAKAHDLDEQADKLHAQAEALRERAAATRVGMPPVGGPQDLPAGSSRRQGGDHGRA